MFRGTARRCIVPAGLFYEWQKVSTVKQLYAIALADEAPASLWRHLGRLAVTGGQSPTHLRRHHHAANHEMSELHDRMPLVLERPNWRLWLNQETGDPRNNDASLIEPMIMASEG